MKIQMTALLLTAFVSSLVSVGALAAATPGETAPAFEAQTASGKTVKLSDEAGKWVVLEWSNKDCPFVKKHYGSGNMQKLQAKYTAKGVKWFTVLSSAKDKQGYLDAAGALANAKTTQAHPTEILLDSSGTIGKAYGAKTTPHMFVINPEGKVVYAGAIDDNDSSDPKVIAKSKNYVAAALDSGMAGRSIATTSTQSYGCGVKYSE